MDTTLSFVLVEACDFIFESIHKGGWVSVCLLAIFLTIVYALAFRYYLLSPGRSFQARRNFSKDQLKDIDCESLQVEYIKELEQLHSRQAVSLSEQLYLEKCEEAKTMSSLLKVCVVLAPMLGLLGTVIGMIETFASLSSSELFSQSGGIAGGISKALLTTQQGLIVSIPGLLGMHFIGRMEKKAIRDFAQSKELFLEAQHA